MIDLVGFRMKYEQPDAKKTTLLMDLNLTLISLVVTLRGTWNKRGAGDLDAGNCQALCIV